MNPRDTAQAPAGAPGSAPLLLTGGTVHSTVEPYAEAMIVEDGLLAWAGSEQTAHHVTDDRFEVQDLDRCLVAPAFVGWLHRTLLAAPPGSSDSAGRTDLHAADRVSEALDGAAARGCGAVRLTLAVHRSNFLELTADIGEGEQTYDRYDAPKVIEEIAAEALAAAARHSVAVWPVLQISGLEDLDLDEPQQASFLMDLIWLARGLDEVAGAPVALEMNLWDVLGTAGGPPAAGLDDQAKERLLEIRRSVAGASRQLILDAAVDSSPATGETAGVVVGVLDSTSKTLRREKQAPAGDLPTVLTGFDGTDRDHWEALVGGNVHVVLRAPGHLADALSVGVPVSAAPAEGESPWQLVTDHVRAADGGVSVRAGFNAQARGAYRGLPGVRTPAGQLNPGAAATYALWEVDSLAVQAPDERTAAWSTDVRARTPLLPYLDGESLPRLRATVVEGVEAHGGHSARIPGDLQGGPAE